MAAEKRKLTREEISAIRAEAGRKGGLTPKKGKQKFDRVSLQVARFDRDVLERYAVKLDTTLVAAFHRLMRVILQNHPDIVKPDGWIETI